VGRRSFLHILGIDLGGGKGKKTALATLRVDAHGVTVVGLAPRAGGRPFYDASLIENLRSFGDGTLVCVDAPLTLPPCLRCTVEVCPGQESCVDPAVVTMRRLVDETPVDARPYGSRGKPAITPYTQRPAEVFLATRRSVVPRETLGQSTGPLAARAAHLVRALADRYRLNENLIEVHPRTTLKLLGLSSPFKRHLKEREHRAQMLESLAPTLKFGPGIWREHCVQSDHLFEAIITAFTGYLWARDGWQAPAEMGSTAARDGLIWVPPEQPSETGRQGVYDAQAAVTEASTTEAVAEG